MTRTEIIETRLLDAIQTKCPIPLNELGLKYYHISELVDAIESSQERFQVIDIEFDTTIELINAIIQENIGSNTFVHFGANSQVNYYCELSNLDNDTYKIEISMRLDTQDDEPCFVIDGQVFDYENVDMETTFQYILETSRGNLDFLKDFINSDEYCEVSELSNRQLDLIDEAVSSEEIFEILNEYEIPSNLWIAIADRWDYPYCRNEQFSINYSFTINFSDLLN